ncbi:Hypothetical protein sce8114 [Sorangium cellulosum So ce56]|uniref:Plastocyanin-like domain-containing protein n=1 Tax=Sorangium cellulosum (strain So ce56) TaxID=448385 RepID=A9FM05_SORC5|nr:Hypothetical protein sce8114 [Sorangium cellulosum So ce56]
MRRCRGRTRSLRRSALRRPRRVASVEDSLEPGAVGGSSRRWNAAGSPASARCSPEQSAHAVRLEPGARWYVPASAQYPETTVLVPVGSTRVIELVPEEPGDWAVHCHMTHHVMMQMGHGLPNMVGAGAARSSSRAGPATRRSRRRRATPARPSRYATASARCFPDHRPGWSVRSTNRPAEQLGLDEDREILIVSLVGHEGLEPSANGLRVHCSTN